MDPAALYGSPEVVRGEVRKMLTSFGTQNYIANLGHGLQPTHTPEQVDTFLTAVRDISLEMNASQTK
jgi:uroporphyrinogen decarboxylase